MKKQFFVLFFLVSSCASYQQDVNSARDLMQVGQSDDAAKVFKEHVDKSKGDRLAYLLEYATALHQGQKFEESSKAFIEADNSAEMNDYTSLSREFGSVMLREDLVQFKTESYEFLLINIYQALNYLMMGNFENAMVMARRINEKINKMELDGNVKKKQLSFAAYLAGLLWDAQDDKDNAYIMYNKAYESAPQNQAIQRDLLVAARASRRDEVYASLKKKWPDIDGSIPWAQMKTQGELVLILEQGWIPRKQPRPDNPKFPTLLPVLSQVRRVKMEVDDKNSALSQEVYDLAAVATQTMEADYARLVAKRVAGTVGRAVLAQGLNQKNKGLGDLAFFALEAMDQADLRQWSTLPATFQMARIYLPVGRHQVKIYDASRDSQPLWSGEVTIRKNKKTFISRRVF